MLTIMRVDLGSSDADREWDALVRRFPGASLFQSAGWARYERLVFGASHLALRASDPAGDPAGLLLASVLPHGVERLIDLPLAGALARVLWIIEFGARRLMPQKLWSGAASEPPRLRLDLRWSHGPLARDVGTAEMLIGEALRQGRAMGASVAGPWVPPLYGSSLTLEPGPWPIQNASTVLVDLKHPEPYLHKSVRWGLNRARRLGLTVEVAGDLAMLREHHAFFGMCREELGLRSYGFRPTRIQWEVLGPYGKERFYSFGVRSGAELYAVMGLWGFGGIAEPLGLAQSRRSLEENSGAADLLIWTAIRTAAAAGAHTFDLTHDVETDDPRLRGIARFKSKWGGVRQPVRIRGQLPIDVAVSHQREAAAL